MYKQKSGEITMNKKVKDLIKRILMAVVFCLIAATAVFICSLLARCSPYWHKEKYEVVGMYKYEGGMEKGYFYMDEYQMNGDTLLWTIPNGVVMEIYPPLKIYKNKTHKSGPYN